MKRYLNEPDRNVSEEILLADPVWVSGRHTSVEVRRNLARLLEADNLAVARGHFATDWARMMVVELDKETCEAAAQLAEVTGARTLDALHLAAAERAGKGALSFVSFDLRLAQAARSLGWNVLGA